MAAGIAAKLAEMAIRTGMLFREFPFRTRRLVHRNFLCASMGRSTPPAFH
jgi:hypothetical protein